MVNNAPEPLPLELDCATFENVDEPVALPLVVAATFIPDAAVPAADAVIAPDTGEMPDGEAGGHTAGKIIIKTTRHKDKIIRRISCHCMVYS